MATFVIAGKEKELKLTYDGVKKLNALYDGGTYELIGKAMMGDLDTFPHIVHAALLHTGEGITFDDVEKAVAESIEEERLDMDGIMRLSNEVVTESFFFKKSVDKLLADNAEAKAALAKLLS